MDSLLKLRRLAGIPIDYSKPENAATTVKPQNPTSTSAPTSKTLNEAAKVPSHRGELAPKTKDNMRARHGNVKKALDALELARECLMDVPAVDYMEDIPSIIKQLHQMLHGDDGTGGVHHLHRSYKHEFDNTVFPEDVEEQKRKEEEDAMATEAGVSDDGKKKKTTNEALGFSVGFTKPVAEPGVEKKNVRPFKLAPDSTEIDKSMYQDPKDEKAVADETPRDTEHNKVEEAEGKKPEWLEKAEVKAEKKEGKSVSKSEEKKVGVKSEEEEKQIHKHHGVTAICAKCGKDPCQCEQAIDAYVGNAVNEVEDEFGFAKDQKDPRPHCPDCGKLGERRGHMGCEYPSDEEEESQVWKAHHTERDAKQHEADLKKAGYGWTSVHQDTATGKHVVRALKKAPTTPSDEEDCATSMMPMESAKTKKPKWLEKAEVKAEKKEGKKVSAKEDKKVNEAQGPLFGRDSQHPKHSDEERYQTWTTDKKPVNVVSQDEPSIYYPNGSKNESPNQLATNPYNETQKVNVPAKITNILKEQAAEARKLAETFNMRKDWDSKNFHENLADAYETLVNFLNKETIYGIKEAQIFMTSLMSPMMNKIHPDVIKYIAAGGQLRSLKNYLNDVKQPVTGVVFSQDSNGLQGDDTGLS